MRVLLLLSGFLALQAAGGVAVVEKNEDVIKKLPVTQDAISPGVPKLNQATGKASVNPAYNCINQRHGDYCILNKQLCGSGDPNVIGFMHQNCAHTCGFCLERTCFDHAKGCEALVSLCHDRNEKDWVTRVCPKTCGICKEPGIPPTTSTQLVTVNPSYNCVNMRNFDDYCRLNKRDCTSQDPAKINYMHEYCAHTCGFCQQRTCFDHAYGCETLKHLCNDRLEGPYIRQNCPKSCGTCSPVTRPTPPTTLAPFTQRPAGLCHDRDANCLHLAYACHDRQYYHWMTINCAVTCNRCYVWPNCADMETLCPTWAALGFCQNPGFPYAKKREVCAKSCGFC